jgi:hypothetical protein
MDHISTCHNSARFSFGVGGKAELREMWSSSLDKTNADYSLINYRSHKSTSSLFLVTIPGKRSCSELNIPRNWDTLKS